MPPARTRRTTGAAIVVLLAMAGCTSETTPSPSALSSGEASASGEPTRTPVPETGLAGLWVDASELIGTTSDYTNRVEIADINGDGFPDLLFAEGGEYESPGTRVTPHAWLHSGSSQPYADVSNQVFGDLKTTARVIRVADLNGDGHPDIVVGTTYQTQSQLLLGSATGVFINVTADHLPQAALDIGDVEVGDVDADGDLDLALADWGPGGPFNDSGAPVRLWLNDGTAHFTDASAQMPSTAVRFSWDLELVDVDNDWDLDLAVAAKVSETSFLFTNDGAGHYTDVTDAALPHFTNNYEFEAMDLDGDGFLDLVTINDGDNVTGEGGREHVFRNDGTGRFTDATDDWWPDEANLSADDAVIVFLDADADGDADFLIASLNGPDRLLINDGTGHLTLESAAFDAGVTGGTLDMAVADLNGDGRLDVVEAQGEVAGAFDEHIYLATETMPLDHVPPVVSTDLAANASGSTTVRARVHSHTRYLPGEFVALTVTWDGNGNPAVPLQWYGEHLFRAIIEVPAGANGLQVCASDNHGNQTCVSAS